MIKKFTYLLLLSTLFLIRSPKGRPDYFIAFDPEPSSIGTNENPSARSDYENQLLADPKTGLIPENIREKELAFAKTLPVKASSSSKFRQKDEEFVKSGPFNVGGRTRAAVLDIRNERTIIAGGVSGGIWRSTDNGLKWERISSTDLRQSVTCLAQDTRSGKEDTWYFGTGELVGNSARSLTAPYRGAGMYKSTDNGNNWERLASTIDETTPDQFTSMFQYIWNMDINEFNTSQDELLVAAYGGILRSTDGGSTWETVLGRKLFEVEDEDLNCSTAPFFTNIHQTSAGVYFATMSSETSSQRNTACKDSNPYDSAGFYYSLNGLDWHDITPAFIGGSFGRTVMASNTAGDEIYFLTSSGTPSLVKYTISSVGESTINGSWIKLPNGIPQLGGEYGDFNSQGGYNMMISVHPQRDEVIYLGGTNLYRSTDGFRDENNTSWIGGYSPENNASQYPSHHADQHFVIFYPSNPNEMLSGSDGGIHKTTNNLRDSVIWTSLNNGFITSQFYSINQRQDDVTNEIIGGMQDNGSWYRDAPGVNPLWNNLLGGDGGYAALTTNSDYFYVSFQNSQIYRLTLGNDYKLKSFARVDPINAGDVVPYLFVNPYQLDPKNENIMFLTGGDFIWRNQNLAQIRGGSQEKTKVGWERLDETALVDTQYSCIAISPSSDRVYAGITGKRPGFTIIHNANDPFERTVAINQAPGDWPEDAHVSALAINPENPDHFLMTISNYNTPSVYESLDGGTTINDISGNLEQYPDGSGNGPSVRWAQIVPKPEGYEYFVGTSIGLYSTTESNLSNTIWYQNSPEEIGNSIVVMMNYRTLDGRMVLATHGNGTFQKYLPDVKLFDPSPAPPERASTKAYPNPFQSKTTISYTLPESGEVIINLYDNSGRLIRNLLFAPQYAGENKIEWDGTNNAGVPLRPGVYFCVLYYNNEKYTERLILQAP